MYFHNIIFDITNLKPILLVYSIENLLQMMVIRTIYSDIPDFIPDIYSYSIYRADMSAGITNSAG